MRMADYKGMMKFDSSRTAHFAPSRFEDPALATCFTSALQQQLVWSRIVRLAGVNLRDRMEFLPTFVIMSTLVVCLLSVLLLPFDVYVVSYRELDGEYPDREQALEEAREKECKRAQVRLFSLAFFLAYYC